MHRLTRIVAIPAGQVVGDQGKGAHILQNESFCGAVSLQDLGDSVDDP